MRSQVTNVIEVIVTFPQRVEDHDHYEQGEQKSNEPLCQGTLFPKRTSRFSVVKHQWFLD